MTGSRLRYGVLGPLSVDLDGEPVRLGGPKERLVLATLLLDAGRVVSSERLIDVLWEEDPPERALATLQVHVSNLRRRLSPGTPTILTRPPGYVLEASGADLDLLRFEELHALARERGAAGRVDGLARLEEGLALWRGPALADLEAVAFVAASRTYLEERRLAAEEDRVALMLRLGRATEALPVIARVLREHPLRERLREHQVLALYRSGRQVDALAAYRDYRDRLLDELGVEPNPRLRALERAVLAHDPRLQSEQEAGGITAPAGGSAGASAAPVEVAATVMAEKRSARLRLADGTAVQLDEVVRLGRHPDCDVVLPDPSVSRRHAEIRPALGGHLLNDLSSSNGTRVGEAQVVHHLLEDGDEIRIGSHVLRYERS